MNDICPDNEIRAPSASLLAFQIRDVISPYTSANSGIHQAAHCLWEQCVALGNQLQIEPLKALYSALRCYTKDSQHPNGFRYTPEQEDQNATAIEKSYLADHLELINLSPKPSQARSLHFHAKSKPHQSLLQGELYALRIHDAYAIDLTLRIDDIVPVNAFQTFSPLRTVQASLGRTCLLIATPPQPDLSQEQRWANQWVAAFLNDPTQQLQPSAQGQLFGSPILEYNHSGDTPNQALHLWVWLTACPQTLQQIGQAEPYHALLNLLCARHKILYAYHQAQQCHTAAQAISQTLEQQVNRLAMPLDESLEQLKQWLKETPAQAFKYGTLIRDVEDHRISIAASAENYASRLNILRHSSLKNDNLDFLEQFLNHTHRFQQQIDVWQRYLTSSQPLFQQMIDTVRGTVEIDAQAKAREDEQRAQERDRSLQIWITAIGSGLAVSGVTSQIAPKTVVNLPDNPNQSMREILPALSINTLFHIGIGVVFAILVLVIAKQIPRSARLTNRQKQRN